MKFTQLTLVSFALGMVGIGCSASALAAPATVDKPARIITSTVRTATIVESVNLQTRELKLMDASGKRFTVIAGPEIERLDEIKPRDRIITEVTESIAVVVTPAGAPVLGQGVAAGKGSTDAGLPEAAGVASIMVQASVVSLNREKRQAVLVDETGTTHTVQVSPTTPLDLVQVGDEVRVRITRAMAISIERPDD